MLSLLFVVNAALETEDFKIGCLAMRALGTLSLQSQRRRQFQSQFIFKSMSLCMHRVGIRYLYPIERVYSPLEGYRGHQTGNVFLGHSLRFIRRSDFLGHEEPLFGKAAQGVAFDA